MPVEKKQGSGFAGRAAGLCEVREERVTISGSTRSRRGSVSGSTRSRRVGAALPYFQMPPKGSKKATKKNGLNATDAVEGALLQGLTLTMRQESADPCVDCPRELGDHLLAGSAEFLCTGRRDP